MLSAAREHKILATYRNWREQPPTWGAMLRRYAGIWLVQVGLALLVFGLARGTSLKPVAWLTGGMALGVILRDLGMIRHQLALWPLVAELLDWSRVSARLDAAPVATSS